jgi:hypothetical protein
MINFTFGVPVKTRLPPRAWVLAALVTMFSLASSIIHSHDAQLHPIYAGVTSSHGSPRG